MAAGTIKPFINTYIIGLNVTLVVFLVVLCDMLINSNNGIILKEKTALYLIFFISFHVLMVMTLFYSKSFELGLNKSILFSINYLFLLYPLFMTKVKPKIIFKTLFWLIIPLSFLFIWKRYQLWLPGSDTFTNPFYELRVFYLNLGALVGVLLLWFFHLRKWSLFAVCFIVLLGLTARGPLLFALLLIVFSLANKFLSNIKNLKLNKKKLAVLGSSALVLISIMFYYSSFLYNLIYETLILRLKGLFTSFDGSILGRFDRLAFAMEYIFESFLSFCFGHGIGSFGLMYNKNEVIDYPHNLFVESWFEMGIIGLLLSLVILISPFFLKGNRIFKIMALFFFLQGMKSYSLVSIWPLFGFYGVLLFGSKPPKLLNIYNGLSSKRTD